MPRGATTGPTHVARSELAKIVTLRSTAITVGLTVVACLLVTGLVSHAAIHHGPCYYQGFDPTQQSLYRHDHRRPWPAASSAPC